MLEIGHLRLCFAFLIFTLGVLDAKAQGGAKALNGRPIITVSNLVHAYLKGERRHSGLDIAEIDVSIDASKLIGIVQADEGDPSSWWLWKGTQSATSINPVKDAMPHHPMRVSVDSKSKVVTLYFSTDQLGIHSGDHLIVLLSAVREFPNSSEGVVLNERGLSIDVGDIEPKQYLSVGGVSVALNEGLENGSTENAIHASVFYDSPFFKRLGGDAHLHLVCESVLSTAVTDLGAYGSGTIYVEDIGFLHQLVPTMKLAPFGRVTMSESINNQAISCGLQATARIRGTEFGARSDFNATRDASLVLIPIEVEDWYRRSSTYDPYLMRPDIVMSSASVYWGPIYLFSRKEVPDIDRDYSLHVSGSVWYFFDRQLGIGLQPATMASRVDIEIQIPFSKLSLNRLIKRQLRLCVAVGNGAVPANGYISSTAFSLGIRGSF